MYYDIDEYYFPSGAGWEYEGMWSNDMSFNLNLSSYYGFEPLGYDLTEDEKGNLMQENSYWARKASQEPKELVFHYNGPANSDDIKDTFIVTIVIKGSGIYESSIFPSNINI